MPARDRRLKAARPAKWCNALVDSRLKCLRCAKLRELETFQETAAAAAPAMESAERLPFFGQCDLRRRNYFGRVYLARLAGVVRRRSNCPRNSIAAAVCGFFTIAIARSANADAGDGARRIGSTFGSQQETVDAGGRNGSTKLGATAGLCCVRAFAPPGIPCGNFCRLLES